MALFINYIFIFISKRVVKQMGHLNSLLDSFSNKYFLIQLKWNAWEHFVTETTSFSLNGVKSIGHESLYTFIEDNFTGFKKQLQKAFIFTSFVK